MPSRYEIATGRNTEAQKDALHRMTEARRTALFLEMERYYDRGRLDPDTSELIYLHSLGPHKKGIRHVSAEELLARLVAVNYQNTRRETR